ncbi:MAG: alpha/beta hydrolase [Myxococcales bacterium]|nr:alpha/beta hydrolase [Myxococcales bacterium]
MLGRAPTLVTAAPPTTAPPQRPPPRDGLVGEWRTLLEPVRLLGAIPWLRAVPRGRGELVVDLPGYLAPAAALMPLRSFLRAKGHDARSWGLGVNRGDPERLRHQFIAALEPMVRQAGMPARLVAWSLGGTVAREAARLRPDLIRQVVVFGSPVIGGPTYTIGAHQIDPAECARIEALQRDVDERDPVQVPLVSIFSRKDRVVDWRASLDHYSVQVRHVEVGSTHSGLGLDPQVWIAVGEALVESE